MRLTLFVALVLFPGLLLADINETIGTEVWILEIIGQLGSLKGAGAMAIAAFATQAVMRFFKTPLAKFAGKWRLLAVSGLTVASMVVAGLAQGLDFGAIMAGSGMLASVQVFLNQAWKQFFQKDETQVHRLG
jgi:hypothetical protein